MLNVHLRLGRLGVPQRKKLIPKNPVRLPNRDVHTHTTMSAKKEPEQQQEIDNNHEPVTPKGTPITLKVRPRTKKTQPGYRSSDGDYFGKYCGDIYGCGDVPNPMRCKCVRCNPIYYWTKKRQPSRPDHPMVAEALAK